MPYLFTSESVSEGHPDKVADQISDALIDYFLAYDPSSKVACETLVTTGQVVLAGEVKDRGRFGNGARIVLRFAWVDGVENVGALFFHRDFDGCIVVFGLQLFLHPG